MPKSALRQDEPLRRCIVSGESAPKEGLIRFVAGPDGTLVPDLAEKLPGRGLWCSADREKLETALRKGMFSRAARQKLTTPEGLADQVEHLLAQRLVEALGLARRAGLAVAGFEKVRERLRAGSVAALLEAQDGAEGGKAKLRPLAGEAKVITLLTGSEMGLAFGRETVIHAALESGGATDRVLRESRRLQGFRDAEHLVVRGAAMS